MDKPPQGSVMDYDELKAYVYNKLELLDPEYLEGLVILLENDTTDEGMSFILSFSVFLKYFFG